MVEYRYDPASGRAALMEVKALLGQPAAGHPGGAAFRGTAIRRSDWAGRRRKAYRKACDAAT
jgi:hypothetical protein